MHTESDINRLEKNGFSFDELCSLSRHSFVLSIIPIPKNTMCAHIHYIQMYLDVFLFIITLIWCRWQSIFNTHKSETTKWCTTIDKRQGFMEYDEMHISLTAWFNWIEIFEIRVSLASRTIFCYRSHTLRIFCTKIVLSVTPKLEFVHLNGIRDRIRIIWSYHDKLMEIIITILINMLIIIN